MMSKVSGLWHEFEQAFEDLYNKIHPELRADADALAAKAKAIAQEAERLAVAAVTQVAVQEKPLLADAAKVAVGAVEKAVEAEIVP
jgi:hypothetical protein